MSFLSGPKLPAAPPPPPLPPVLASSQTQDAQAAERAAAAAAAGGQGFANTIGSSPQGTAAPTTSKKQLFGS